MALAVSGVRSLAMTLSTLMVKGDKVRKKIAPLLKKKISLID